MRAAWKASSFLISSGKIAGALSAPPGRGKRGWELDGEGDLDGEESHIILPVQNPQGESPVGQRTVPTSPGFWNGCAGL